MQYYLSDTLGISDFVIRLLKEVWLEAVDKIHRKRSTMPAAVVGHYWVLQKRSVVDLKGVHYYHQMTLEGHSQEALTWEGVLSHHSDL